MAALEHKPAGRVSVVFAVTGIRGVGKTQVGAAYARQRMADGWRLVAWVDASDEASVLAGLAQVAVATGVGPAGEDARVLADRVRHWLEADGERRLIVFDNALSLDMLRPFLPAGGTAQVVITSSRRSTADLGTPVAVDVFSESEALAFLLARTALDDDAGARELADELGSLPLGLAQAAALITRQHLTYGTYLERLRALPVAEYLRRVEGDAYSYRLAEAIMLSLHASELDDPSGMCGRLMDLVSVLAETGVSRRVLHLAADAEVLGDGQVRAAGVDAGVGELADASLVGFTVDDSVVAHRLVRRVARERLAAEGGLPLVLAGAVRTLTVMAGEIGEAWRDPPGVRELAGHVGALAAQAVSHPDAVAGEVLATFLQLRRQSVFLLNMIGDSTGLAIAAAEPLAADCERLLGIDHPDTLSARADLAHAYMNAGRMTKAILLLERTLADCERLQGADHPRTLTSRGNLGLAYRDAGRIGEAIPLLERTLADYEQLRGTDHPNTLASRNNLALAYGDAGRIGEAIPLHERTLADRERLLGTDHPDTLTSLNNLAGIYSDAGQTAEAISLLERTLADRERLLGSDHPHTLLSRGNLAEAYRDAGRTAEAIPLSERTLADCERLLGTDHPDTLMSRGNLAVAYHAAGRMAEAIPLHERTLAERERLLGTDHPHTLMSRGNLAEAYREAGRTAEGIPLSERTLADRERLLGTDHPHTLMSRGNLAAAYHAVGRTAEAIPLLERTLADRERLLGTDDPKTKVVRENLAALTGERKRIKHR